MKKKKKVPSQAYMKACTQNEVDNIRKNYKTYTKKLGYEKFYKFLQFISRTMTEIWITDVTSNSKRMQYYYEKFTKG